MTRIDPIRFAHLRNAAGLSRREVARLAGVTSTAVASIEAGASWRLTLEAAGRLAAAVGATLPDILEDEGSVGPAAEARGDSDMAQVEAILFTARRELTLQTIAEVTGWDLSRARQAMDNLIAHPGRGGIQGYRHNGGRAGLRATAQLQRKVLVAIERHMTTREGLLQPTAAMLRRVWTLGSATSSNRLNLSRNPDRVAFGRLVNAGLVTHGAKRPVLAPDVAFSLAPLENTVVRVVAPAAQPIDRMASGRHSAESRHQSPRTELGVK